jgi:uncharacterized membrane protein YkvA (DUF1232 family)
MNEYLSGGGLAAPPAAAVADRLAIQRPRFRRGGAERRSGERETLGTLIRDIPNFLRLLGRLARDPRVSRVDKAILLATIAYLVTPMDLIPDYIPFLGQMDDLYLLALALDRLLNNAGVDVLLEHWEGELSSLETAIAALDRTASFLPDQVRSLLQRRVG